LTQRTRPLLPRRPRKQSIRDKVDNGPSVAIGCSLGNPSEAKRTFMHERLDRVKSTHRAKSCASSSFHWLDSASASVSYDVQLNSRILRMRRRLGSSAWPFLLVEPRLFHRFMRPGNLSIWFAILQDLPFALGSVLQRKLDGFFLPESMEYIAISWNLTDSVLEPPGNHANASLSR
jgi:hypothetical protein